MKKIYSSILLLGVCVCSYAQIWTQKANFPGASRYYATGFAIGHYGFIGTGSNGSTPYNDFYKWNQKTNTWTGIANYPGVGYYYSPVAFTIEGKGYVGLGWNGSSGSTDLWRYDTATNTWSGMAAFPGKGRYDEGVFVLGHKAYVVCGTPGGKPYLKDVWMYDAHQNTWTRMGDFAGGKVDGPVGFSIGNRGYIGGGIDSNNLLHSTFWEYDSTSDKWTTIASFPIAGIGGDAQAFVLGRKAYVCVGSGPSPAKTLSDGYAYDTASKVWSAFTNMGVNKIERNYAVAFKVGNYGYIGTGTDSNGTYLNTYWQYTDTVFLAVNEISTPNTEIILYPNPSNGVVNLQYKELSGSKAQLCIIDAMGREVKQLTLSGNEGKITFDASGFANGMYFYRVTDSEGKLFTGKFIMRK